MLCYRPATIYVGLIASGIGTAQKLEDERVNKVAFIKGEGPHPHEMSRASAYGCQTLAFLGSVTFYPKLPARPNGQDAGLWFRESRFEPPAGSQPPTYGTWRNRQTRAPGARGRKAMRVRFPLPRPPSKQFDYQSDWYCSKTGTCACGAWRYSPKTCHSFRKSSAAASTIPA